MARQVGFDQLGFDAVLPPDAGIASPQTQVLLCSHHEHIINVFDRAVGGDRYCLHRLERADAAAT